MNQIKLYWIKLNRIFEQIFKKPHCWYSSDLDWKKISHFFYFLNFFIGFSINNICQKKREEEKIPLLVKEHFLSQNYIRMYKFPYSVIWCENIPICFTTMTLFILKNKSFLEKKRYRRNRKQKVFWKKWFEKKHIVRNHCSCYNFSNICQYRCEKYCVICR